MFVFSSEGVIEDCTAEDGVDVRAGERDRRRGCDFGAAGFGKVRDALLRGGGAPLFGEGERRGGSGGTRE